MASHRKIGIPIKGIKLKDGKVERDLAAEFAKLSVCQKIAAKKSTKIKVVKPRGKPT